MDHMMLDEILMPFQRGRSCCAEPLRIESLTFIDVSCSIRSPHTPERTPGFG
jgi:hypothetical protein